MLSGGFIVIVYRGIAKAQKINKTVRMILPDQNMLLTLLMCQGRLLNPTKPEKIFYKENLSI